MNKNAQILIGVGVLSLGGFLYWKSTQSGTLNATGAVSNKKNATGAVSNKKNATGVKAVPKEFFKTKGSVDGINNFKNAAGVFTKTPAPVKKVFESADGFKAASSEKVFAFSIKNLMALPRQKKRKYLQMQVVRLMRLHKNKYLQI